MEFEFDDRKAKSNLAKHGISFLEASVSLLDPMSLWVEDPDSLGEGRWITWGMSSAGRVLTVVHTTRGDSIRIISARKATRKERLEYAKRIRSV